MADFSTIKAEIDAKIVPDNHAQLITGRKLNDTLKDLVDAVDGAKQDVISDLSQIRERADEGHTALQPSALTPYRTAQAQDLVDQILAGMVNDKYTKPNTGIPATDLASAVQTSLGKADSALQDAPSDGKQYLRKDGAWSEVDVEGTSIQVTELPDAASKALGTIVQYVGETTDSLTNGYFYKVVLVRQGSIFIQGWERTDVQPSTPDEIPASNVIFEDEEDAQTKVTELEQNVGNLQTTVGGHTTSISSLQTTIAGHTTAIAALQTEIDSFIGAQTNFLTFFPDVASLPTPTAPSWALVGADIDALNAYVWNGTAWAMFGTKTYDFTDFSDLFVKEYSINKLDTSAVTTGKYVNSSTGNLANSSSYVASDYIPVDVSKGIAASGSQSGGTAIGCAAYDSNKVFTHGSHSPNIDIVEGDAYVRYSIKEDSLETAMVFDGNINDKPPRYIPFGYKNVIKESRLSIDIDSFRNTDVETGKNLLNPNEIMYDHVISGTSGNLYSLPSTSAGTYAVSNFVKVDKRGIFFNHIVYSSGSYQAGAWVYDASHRPLRKLTSQYSWQEGDAYVRYTMLMGDISTAQIEIGTQGTSYEPYRGRKIISPSILPSFRVSDDDITRIKESLAEEKIYSSELTLLLPRKIYAVEGDTLQLFFKGMVRAVNPLNYNIKATCVKGRQYHRYWEYTPADNDSRENSLSIKVYDDNRNILANESCQIVTVPAPTSPSSSVHILAIGASTTAGGQWVCECQRRLLGTGGTPEGDGIDNISFVGDGTKTLYGQTAHFLAHSGWAWSDYVTEGRGSSSFRFFLTDIAANVNVGNVYSNNGHQYTVTEINVIDNVLTILCEASSSSDTPSASGTLTLVDGTGDAEVTFTSSQQDSQNPLWDSVNNTMTFVPFVEEYCGGQLDVVYTLLEGNQLFIDIEQTVAYIKTFLDTLHSEYPNCKVHILGSTYPSMELMMPGYGASGDYSDTYKVLCQKVAVQKAFKAISEMTEYSGYVQFESLAVQFDSDYGYPIVLKNVNTRNSTIQEGYAGNTVHPAEVGYMQIADAVYRSIVANYCQEATQ